MIDKKEDVKNRQLANNFSSIIVMLQKFMSDNDQYITVARSFTLNIKCLTLSEMRILSSSETKLVER